jgi:hypothetical protein
MSRGRGPSHRWRAGPLIGLAFVVLTFCGSLSLGCAETSLEQVRLESGPIVGAHAEVEGQRVWSFKGIPYAAPPVDDLRWQPPQPVEPWTESRDCTEFGAACPQPAMFEMFSLSAGRADEDCLYLNVWSPAQSAGERLPVMVWIHGGSLETGSGAMEVYNGRYLAANGVVVVTMSRVRYEAQVRKILGDYAEEALALYPVTGPRGATHALSRMLTEVGFASTARFAARSMSVDASGGLPRLPALDRKRTRERPRPTSTSSPGCRLTILWVPSTPWRSPRCSALPISPRGWGSSGKQIGTCRLPSWAAGPGSPLQAIRTATGRRLGRSTTKRRICIWSWGTRSAAAAVSTRRPAT